MAPRESQWGHEDPRGRRRPRRARRAAPRADARRATRSQVGRRRPAGARRRSPPARPTRSCSTSGCPTSTGSRSAGACAARGNRIPILMLTARDAVSDRIDGPRRGRRRLPGQAVRRRRAQGPPARAAAPHRRATATPTRSRSRSCGSTARATASASATQFVELTRTEYQLLELLMLNPRRVLPHGLIYDRVWGYDFGPASNALRVYVGYLRRKLEDAGARPSSTRCAASATCCASHDPAQPHRGRGRHRRGAHRRRRWRCASTSASRSSCAARSTRRCATARAPFVQLRRRGRRDGDGERARTAARRTLDGPGRPRRRNPFGGAAGLRAVRRAADGILSPDRPRRAAAPRLPVDARTRAIAAARHRALLQRHARRAASICACSRSASARAARSRSRGR